MSIILVGDYHRPALYDSLQKSGNTVVDISYTELTELADRVSDDKCIDIKVKEISDNLRSIRAVRKPIKMLVIPETEQHQLNEVSTFASRFLAEFTQLPVSAYCTSDLVVHSIINGSITEKHHADFKSAGLKYYPVCDRPDTTFVVPYLNEPEQVKALMRLKS